MQNLERRVQKLEERHLEPNEEMAIIISSLCPPDQEAATERQYPPIEEQIAAERAAGKRVFMVFDF